MADLVRDVFRIVLSGRFRIEAPDNSDLTPISLKAQGLLALLATDAHLCRQRVWLQDKLWSTSPPELGAASLRQALAQIRRSLGPWADALVADRRSVRLVASRVTVVRNLEEEFLEGIDMRDPEFEFWLQTMRSQSGVTPVKAKPNPAPALALSDRPNFRQRRMVIVEATNPEATRLGLIEARFADMVCLSLREMFDFDARRRATPSVQTGAMALSVHAFDTGQAMGLRLAIHGAAGDAPLWADTVIAPMRSDGDGFATEHLGLSHRATSRLVDLLSQPLRQTLHSRDADHLAGVGLRKMFSMRLADLTEADTLFQQAYADDPRGVFLGWRAQLAVIRFVESGGASRQELAELSRALCAEALAKDPTNSNVLASVANARLVFENDGAASRELSRLGVLANPSNPLAWWSWANGLLYTNDPQKAHSAAKTAQMLARNAPFRFWTDFQVSLTAAVTGNTSQAIANAELSRILSPNFRPPLRYLLGLYAATHRLDEAREVLVRLKQAEPDFSIDRLIDDPAYPVSMMRKAGLVNAKVLRDL